MYSSSVAASPEADVDERVRLARLAVRWGLLDDLCVELIRYTNM